MLKISFFFLLGLSLISYHRYGELYPLPFGPGFPGKLFRLNSKIAYTPRLTVFDSQGRVTQVENPVVFLGKTYGLQNIFLKLFPIPVLDIESGADNLEPSTILRWGGSSTHLEISQSQLPRKIGASL